MASHCLMIEVHLHQPCWHATGEWPPSPFRLFQALLAGAALGRSQVGQDDADALDFLAGLGAPIVAAPHHIAGNGVTMFMPNNDLDAVNGDLNRIAEIRGAKKRFAPRWLTSEPKFRYLWPLTENQLHHRGAVQELATRLYQFGWGLDPAFATVRLLSPEDARQQALAWTGAIWPPSETGGAWMRVPTPRSREDLCRRRAELAQRGRSRQLKQAAPPDFALAGYGREADFLLFDLRREHEAGFVAYPARSVHDLAAALRQGLTKRLADATPTSSAMIESALIGRKGDGDAAKQSRVQIIPLPSIGFEHADGCIRRVLLRRPGACPIPTDDLSWAASGLEVTIDGGCATLAPADDRAMLGHYAMGTQPATVWASITPVALAPRHQKRRLDGDGRQQRDHQIAASIRAAVRHAGVQAGAVEIQGQKEPWRKQGDRAEYFAQPPRFSHGNLWHIRIRFDRPVNGPLLIGNGRYLGLGLLAPVEADPADETKAFVLPIAAGCRPAAAQRALVTQALRRALMSRARDRNGNVPTLFSGHDGSTAPAASGSHRHVYLAAIPSAGGGEIEQLIVIAPWAVDRNIRAKPEDSAVFAHAVSGLLCLRAGPAGRLILEPAQPPDRHSRLFALAKQWISLTPYRPTRHPRKSDARESHVCADIVEECSRRGLPRPEVKIENLQLGARGGAQVRASLVFAVPVAGPILLGRDAHRGGGLFAPI